MEEFFNSVIGPGVTDAFGAELQHTVGTRGAELGMQLGKFTEAISRSQTPEVGHSGRE